MLIWCSGLWEDMQGLSKVQLFAWHSQINWKQQQPLQWLLCVLHHPAQRFRQYKATGCQHPFWFITANTLSGLLLPTPFLVYYCQHPLHHCQGLVVVPLDHHMWLDCCATMQLLATATLGLWERPV
jgi:hypothetical protein